MNSLGYAYTYDDVALVPQYNNIPSRTIPSLNSWLTTKTKIGVPIVAANMDTVIGDDMADTLLDLGSIPIFHRFTTEEERLRWANKYGDKCFMSCGLNDINFTLKLLKETPIRGVCIDIAHAHSSTMKNYMEEIRRNVGNTKEIIAGNVCTPMAYHDLVTWGADAVKCGIGPGCFKGDTRVLMANGTYKNIKDIEVGDKVINMNGKPVKVLNKMNKGVRPVIKLNIGLHYDDIVVTKDHKFFVGDLSSCSSKTVSSAGIAKILDKKSKTVPKKSKYKWKEIDQCTLTNAVLLLPKNINWDIPENFKIDLANNLKKGEFDDDYIKTKGSTNGTVKFNRYIESCYDLGYIFGTYLGDGSSKVQVNKKTKCETATTQWYFSINEGNIANKLSDSINRVLGIRPTIKDRNGNVKLVTLYNKCFTKILHEFGKKKDKSLKQDYFCSNNEYIKGIYDGLMDSDGNREKYSINTVDRFTNTSKYLMELFSWCCINLGKSFGCSKTTGKAGGLKGVSDNSVFNNTHRIKVHTSNRFTKDYLYTRILSKQEHDDIEVWDIEVDCPTHSFIANNVIVHNSACTTRMVTGFGMPQFSAVRECAEVAEKLRVPLIADGGIRNSRDVALALAAGASTVMAGSLFSNTYESAAPKEVRDGVTYSKYRGQASEDFQVDFYGGLKKDTVAEGIAFEKVCDRSARDVMGQLTGGLRSALTYGGARDIKEFQRKAEFRLVTSNYIAESKPRPNQK